MPRKPRRPANQYTTPTASVVRRNSVDLPLGIVDDDLTDEVIWAFGDERPVWAEHGFESHAAAAPWIDLGMSPDEAQGWAVTILGDPGEASRWNDQGFNPDVAVLWKEAGFDDPQDALEWVDSIGGSEAAVAYAQQLSDAGLSPSQAHAKWRNAGIPEHAIAFWTAAGYTDPEVARRWSDAGWGEEPVVEEWVDDSAEWRAAGVDPKIGFDWYDNAFTIDEMGEYLAAGSTDPRVLRSQIGE